MSQIQTKRKKKGLIILSKINDITKIGKNHYLVNSQTTDKQYHVKVTSLNIWSCTCPDFMLRLQKRDDKRCKHIHSCIALKNAIEQASGIKKEGVVSICVRCDSNRITKNGFRIIKNGKRQRYACKKCKYKFTLPELGFAKTSKDSHVITEALDMFLTGGMSSRKVATHFGRRNVCMSHAVVLLWCKKYMNMIRYYVNNMMPEVGEVLSVDEMVLNIRNTEKRKKGFYGWLWGSIDPKTRFVLSVEVSKRRAISDAQKIMKSSMTRTASTINYIVTDSLAAYDEAIKQECRKGTAHIKTKSFEKGFENRAIERYWNEFREIIKTKRGLDNEKSAAEFAEFYRIFHNFVRPHSGLDGMTPAEAAGLYENLGSDKLASLIRRAIEHKKSGIHRLGTKRLDKVTITNEKDSIRVKPNCWIEKRIWREINDILRLDGFAWLTNGKDSCWLKMTI